MRATSPIPTCSMRWRREWRRSTARSTRCPLFVLTGRGTTRRQSPRSRWPGAAFSVGCRCRSRISRTWPGRARPTARRSTQIMCPRPRITSSSGSNRKAGSSTPSRTRQNSAPAPARSTRSLGAPITHGTSAARWRVPRGVRARHWHRDRPGLRPAPGRVPKGPGSNAFGTLLVSGPKARNVGDVGLLLDAMSGPDHRDPTAQPAPDVSFRR
jgi:hypothetical protein